MKRFDATRRRVLAGPGAFAGASLQRVHGLGETVTTMDFEQVFHDKVPRKGLQFKIHEA